MVTRQLARPSRWRRGGGHGRQGCLAGDNSSDFEVGSDPARTRERHSWENRQIGLQTSAPVLLQQLVSSCRVLGFELHAGRGQNTAELIPWHRRGAIYNMVGGAGEARI